MPRCRLQGVTLLVFALLVFLVNDPMIVSGLPDPLDASKPDSSVYLDTLYGANLGWRSGDKAGSSLASGDVDGDGLEDLIIGSPFAVSEVDTRVDSGVVSIVFGDTLASQNKSLDLANADCRFYGTVSNQLLGHSLACADINGDGLDDIIIGAPGYGPPLPGQTGTQEDYDYLGAFYVIQGRSRAGFPSYANITYMSRYYAFGASHNQQLGFRVETGDLNGDGLDDVFVSAIEKDPLVTQGKWGGTGKVYCFNGNANLPQGELGTENASCCIYGTTLGEGLGFCLALGDVDNDGMDDLMIGAPYYTEDLVSQGIGRVYCVRGQKDLEGDVNLTDDSLFIITGDKAGSMFGYCVACGDFDDDGIDDLAVSAPEMDAGAFKEAGRIFVYSGGDLLKGDLIPASDQYSFSGGGSGDNSGSSLAFITFPDQGNRRFLAVGCPRSNGSDPNGALVGEVYLLECKTGWTDGESSTLPESSASVIYGQCDGDMFGTCVGSISLGSSGTQGRAAMCAPEADGEGGKRPDSGIIYLVRWDPKDVQDPNGTNPGQNENVTMPQGITGLNLALLLGVTGIFFVVFLAVVYLFYRKKNKKE